MANVVCPPHPTLVAAADELDRFAGAILAALSRPDGEWEALDEAMVMIWLTVRHVDGVVTLARTDEVLLAPAWAAGRACIEAGATVRWLLEPADPFEREARWLARVNEDISYADAVAKAYGKTGDSVVRDKTVAFRDGVAAKLPKGIVVPKRAPKMEDLLAGDERIYGLYREASQYVHGSHYGAGLFRQHLGTDKRFEERIRTRSWFSPLYAAAWGLGVGAAAFVQAVPSKPWPEAEAAAMNEAIGALLDVDEPPD